MANITNRSPWVVSAPGKEEQKFRLKSQAQTYLDSLNNTRAKMRQLETSFEVQIKLKDSKGNTVTRSATHSTRDEAERWAREEEEAIKSLRENGGTFNLSFETMTVEQALNRCWEEHYKGRPSADENLHRIPKLVEILGKDTLLRQLNSEKILNLKKSLIAEQYSASSVRNFFCVISRTLQRAKGEWLFPIENYTKGIELEKPKNAKNRSFKGNERERLFASIDKHRPWLRPIVELSLEMTFRRSELVQPAKKKRAQGLKGGLTWEGVDFDKNTLRLFQEKNDWQKKNTEEKGRVVPMTDRMREILLDLYQKSETKTGLVFKATVNSVSHAFSDVCKLAEPAIEDLTFHSCRKIGTYAMSKKVPNAIVLSKITGHKDLKTLASRYYDVPMEDLQVMLSSADADTLEGRAIIALKRALGFEDTLRFLIIVKETKDLNTLLIGKTSNATQAA
ncbi:tyrosine-type recombinase/integrase [Burkholderia cepacia]|uniref:tyrosine-type recombinase/integrase n=1 Tax=Burkholderia cepacia TaxID=292 RepID=UPI0026DF25F7|nr:site-specific integrase [Burkholderia cepacia]MDO5943409.1 site-specific integrase [Burkholderia cepacia]